MADSDDYEDDFEEFEEFEADEEQAKPELNEPVRRAPKGVREQIGQFVSHPMEAPGPIKTLGAKSPGRDGGNGGGPWAPQMRFFFRKHTAGVNDCCIDPRGRFVATVSDDQSALVWSATTGQLVCSLSGGASARSEIRTCSFNPDGVLLATGSASGAIELWDASNASVASASGSSWPAYRALETAHAAAVNCVAWMPLRGSKTLLTVGDDKHLRWWECSTPHCATTCDFELRSAGNAVAASPDGRVVVVGCEDGSVDVYVVANSSQGWKLQCSTQHESAVTGVAFRRSPDPNATAEAGHPYVFVSMSRGDGATLCVWQLDPERSTCSLVHKLPGQTGYNVCVKPAFFFEPDTPAAPAHVLSPLAAKPGDGAPAQAEQPPGTMHVRLLVPLSRDAGSKGAVCVVDEAGATLLGQFRAHGENVRACCVTDDGAVFVTCSTNDHAKMWLAPAAARLAKQRAEAERLAQMRARMAEQQAKDDAKKAKNEAAKKKTEEKKKKKKKQYEEAVAVKEAEAEAADKEKRKAAAAEAERQAVAAKMAAAMKETEERLALEETADQGKEHRRKKRSAKKKQQQLEKQRQEEAARAARAAEIDNLL